MGHRGLHAGNSTYYLIETQLLLDIATAALSFHRSRILQLIRARRAPRQSRSIKKEKKMTPATSRRQEYGIDITSHGE